MENVNKQLLDALRIARKMLDDEGYFPVEEIDLAIAAAEQAQQADPVAYVKIGNHAPIVLGSDGLRIEGTPSGALKVTCTREHVPVDTSGRTVQNNHVTDAQLEEDGYVNATAAQQQAEPVAWEYREFHDDNTVTPGWGKWKRIESEEWAGRSIKSVVADIHEFIAQGYRYELRALYAQPPAVAVPDECVAVASALTSQYMLRNSSGTLYCMHCLHDCENRESHDKDCPVLQARAIVNDSLIAAAPQAATEGCGACGDGCQGQGCRLELESPPTCQKCNGAGVIRGLLSNGGGSYAEPCPDCAAQKVGQ